MFKTVEELKTISEKMAHRFSNAHYSREDAAQDFFRGVWEAFKSEAFDANREGATSYLWRAGYNAVKEGKRAILATGTTWRISSSGRDYIAPVSLSRSYCDDGEEVFADAVEDVKGENPVLNTIHKEINEIVYALPDNLRKVFRRHVDGETFGEIAEDLGISDESARLWYHKAIGILRNKIAA